MNVEKLLVKYHYNFLYQMRYHNLVQTENLNIFTVKDIHNEFDMIPATITRLRSSQNTKPQK